MRELVIVFTVLTAAYSAFAQTPQEIFRDTVLPTLQRECAGCHGATQTLSKLDLRTRETVLQGGVRGPALVPGNATQSILVQVLEGKGGLQMPPGDSTRETPCRHDRSLSKMGRWRRAMDRTRRPRKGGTTRTRICGPFARFAPRDKTKSIDDFIATRLRERGLDSGSASRPADADSSRHHRSRPACRRLRKRSTRSSATNLREPGRI